MQIICSFSFFKAYCFQFCILILRCLSWSTSMFSFSSCFFNHSISFIWAPNFRHIWLGTTNVFCHSPLESVFWFLALFHLIVLLLSPYFLSVHYFHLLVYKKCFFNRPLLVFVVGMQIISFHDFFSSTLGYSIIFSSEWIWKIFTINSNILIYFV